MEMELWTGSGKQRIGQIIKESIYATQKAIGRENWSQRKMAEKCGISHVALGNYCRGNIEDPSKDNYRVIKAIAPYVCRLLKFDGESPILDNSITYKDDWQELYQIGTRTYEITQSPKIETGLIEKTEVQPTEFGFTEMEEEAMLLSLIPEQIARRGIGWEQFADSYFFLRKLSQMLSKPSGDKYSVDELIEICDRGLNKK